MPTTGLAVLLAISLQCVGIAKPMWTYCNAQTFFDRKLPGYNRMSIAARVLRPSPPPSGVRRLPRKNPIRPKVTSTGAWGELPKNYSYFLDQNLARHLAELFRGKSVLELGAGEGHYHQFLRNSGIVGQISSYDGVPNIAEFTNGLVQTADLSKELSLPAKDWVLCTEVGEHVPAQYEKILIQNLVRHARTGVLLSWGLPKQGGHGHVNLLTNQQVVEKMTKANFCLLPETSQRMREGSSFKHFKMTIMAFLSAVGDQPCSQVVEEWDTMLSQSLLNVNPNIRRRGSFIYHEKFN